MLDCTSPRRAPKRDSFHVGIAQIPYPPGPRL
jgi:hypothetical protein